MPFIGNKPSAIPLTSADIADSIITSAKIVDGTIVNADINASAGIVSSKLSGTGKVLQVVTATTSTNVLSSTSTFVDTGLTASITPSSASNKILVLVSQNGTDKRTNNAYMELKLFRGATQILHPATQHNFTNTTMTLTTNFSFSYLDSPSTTSSTTYKTQFCSSNNNAQVGVQQAGNPSTIILMEIAG